MKRPFVVYCLQHPTSGEVRYVGMSRHGRGRGYYWLRKSASKKNLETNKALAEWIQELGQLIWHMKRKIVQVIEVLPNDLLLSKREAYWIKAFSKDGHNLFNKIHNPKFKKSKL